jgi:hypothetical protein
MPWTSLEGVLLPGKHGNGFVGAFGKPRTCHGRTVIGSKLSIVFRQLLTFTIWGICSSLDSNPGTLNR